MDWSNEIYVRVYTRETDDDLALSWEARALWDRMLTKFDRSGIIPTRRGPRGLAALVRIPPNVVEHALPELLADGRVQEVNGGYLAPNFTAAQEASKSDRLRQKESRERARTQKLTNRDDTVTNRDEIGSAPTVGVTERHELSRDVTLCFAELTNAELSESPARAIHIPTPTPEPVPQPHAEPPAPAITAPIAQAPAARMGGDVAAIGSGSGGVRALPDEWRVLAREVWEGARKRYAELHAAGVDPSAKPPEYTWPGLETADVTARMRELLDRGIAVGVARVMCRAAIASAAKRAQDTRKLRYFTPPRFFEARSFAISASEMPESGDGGASSSGNGLITVGRPRAPGDDEPRFSGPPIEMRPPMSPEERAARLAALAAPHQPPRTTGDA